jgi:hypothetical protein
MKFLIDESLSAELANAARARGYDESSHVRWLGRAGWPDQTLNGLIREDNWTFVTKNARVPGAACATCSARQRQPVEAGVVCFNLPSGTDLDLQLELFELALDEIGASGLLHQVLDVTLDGTDVVIRRLRATQG